MQTYMLIVLWLFFFVTIELGKRAYVIIFLISMWLDMVVFSFYCFVVFFCCVNPMFCRTIFLKKFIAYLYKRLYSLPLLLLAQDQEFIFLIFHVPVNPCFLYLATCTGILYTNMTIRVHVPISQLKVTLICKYSIT